MYAAGSSPVSAPNHVRIDAICADDGPLGQDWALTHLDDESGFWCGRRHEAGDLHVVELSSTIKRLDCALYVPKVEGGPWSQARSAANGRVGDPRVADNRD